MKHAFYIFQIEFTFEGNLRLVARSGVSLSPKDQHTNIYKFLNNVQICSIFQSWNYFAIVSYLNLEEFRITDVQLYRI